MKNNWIVRVYSSPSSANELEKFVIKDRTEQQAHKEAMSYVEKVHPACDWTMVEDT